MSNDGEQEQREDEWVLPPKIPGRRDISRDWQRDLVDPNGPNG